MRNYDFYVYILASKKLILYIGMTNNLLGRLWQHKHAYKNRFAYVNQCHKLVYYEHFTDVWVAIRREKQLKNWHRNWKLNLIKRCNPLLDDLFTRDFS